jgi:hypothetical protein
VTSSERRLKRAALETARRQGCTCQPVITLISEDPLWRAQVAHDDWCPAARSNERAIPGIPTGPVVFVPPGWKAGEP